MVAKFKCPLLPKVSEKKRAQRLGLPKVGSRVLGWVCQCKGTLTQETAKVGCSLSSARALGQEDWSIQGWQMREQVERRRPAEN
jgi:hypothetical protein